MASSQSHNRQVIDYAFKRLLLSEKTIITEGLENLANSALDILLDAHEYYSPHLVHPHENKTLGWAISQNGRVLKTGAHYGNEYFDTEGGAVEMAADEAKRARCWSAVILSDMRGFYSWPLEEDFLTITKEEVRDRFPRFFRRVKR